MNDDEKLEKARQTIRAMVDKKPRTDKELVIELKEDLTKALSKGAYLKDIFPILRATGFKGDIRKFTKILEELGLWTIKSKVSA